MRERESESESERVRESVCVYGCVCDGATLAEVAHTLRAELHLVRGSGGQTAKYFVYT